jgi:hypothetical protein
MRLVRPVGDHYEYIAVYVDVAICFKDPAGIIRALTETTGSSSRADPSSFIWDATSSVTTKAYCASHRQTCLHLAGLSPLWW